MFIWDKAVTNSAGEWVETVARVLSLLVQNFQCETVKGNSMLSFVFGNLSGEYQKLFCEVVAVLVSLNNFIGALTSQGKQEPEKAGCVVAHVVF